MCIRDRLHAVVGSAVSNRQEAYLLGHHPGGQRAGVLLDPVGQRPLIACLLYTSISRPLARFRMLPHIRPSRMDRGMDRMAASTRPGIRCLKSPRGAPISMGATMASSRRRWRSSQRSRETLRSVYNNYILFAKGS